MITEIEDYFKKGCDRCARFATPDCSTRLWAEGLRDLRRICCDAGLEETVKWGHPCYMHAGRNIVIMGAFRGDFRLTFFNAALMTDPERVLERSGPNSRHPDVLRFADNDQVVAREPVIRAYLAEAMAYAQEGRKPPRDDVVLEFPEELTEALDADAELAEAFHALTPGRQKSYVINLRNAKKPETRTARIIGFRDKILAGKGALDR
ncbi:MAG: YdeI/OmpD-associated family protein [Pseudomonadota bacterium]|nr:YdeI/OmpD-associated family protein [Pseudomonadota bacterium]MEE3069616.1 YdeI/OmpD-associated family protein [Pseudomonadota bacterium]